jgi:hypothetical protein
MFAVIVVRFWWLKIFVTFLEWLTKLLMSSKNLTIKLLNILLMTLKAIILPTRA